MTLTCVICLRVRPANPRKAETVANGQAVCLVHLPYVAAWPDLETAVKIAAGNEGLT